MSHYTTEVRFICEQKAGLDTSTGFTDVNMVLDNSWDKIFTTQATIFDENYRPIICKKILKHYYTREIGAETVGLWQLWMNTKLEEILPYYNKLWQSALLEFDPFKDVDYTREGNRTENTTDTREEKTESVNNSTLDKETHGKQILDRDTTSYDNNVNRDLYSDTPQGALDGVEQEKYLTNARKIMENNKNTGTQDDTVTTNTNENNKGKDVFNGLVNDDRKGKTEGDYFERIAGKMATVSYSELLEKYRKTFINIDLLVIREFKDLFLNLW